MQAAGANSCGQTQNSFACLMFSALSRAAASLMEKLAAKGATAKVFMKREIHRMFER